MIRPALCTLTSLALSAAALSAQIPDSVFKGASYPYGSDSLYSFDSPIPFDITAIALTARPDFQPTHPDTSLIKKFYEEQSSVSWVPFEGPLPAFLPARHYWVLGDSGATEVYPHKVKGSIYIHTEAAGWPVKDLRYFGSLQAPRPPGMSVGALRFGFFSPRPIRVRSARATIGGTALRPTVRTYLEPRRIEVTIDSTGRNRGRDLMPIHARAFQILGTGQSFLSVLWADDDICAGESVLYDISTGVPRFIALSFGACGE